MTTEPHHRMMVLDGTCAAVTGAGDITGARGSGPEGLFVRDARHLSRWQLTVDGAIPAVLVATTTGPTGGGAGPNATAVLTPPGGRADPPAHTIFRDQRVTAGTLTDHLRVTNNEPQPYTALVALTADADFADQFELRPDHRWYDKRHAVRTRETLPNGVTFTYQRREWHARTVITADPAPDAIEETGSGARRLLWQLPLDAYGTTEIRLRVTAHPPGAPDSTGDTVPARGTAPAGGTGGTTATGEAESSGDTDAFRTAAPRPADLPGAVAWPALADACEQGLADLATLRVTTPGPDGEPLRVPAAGAPWFLTLIARQALFTSLFALPYRPELATDTLLALAATQSTGQDAGRAAQPGRIVHEIRDGELAYFGQVPYGRYHGAIDATPLFLVLLGAVTQPAGPSEPGPPAGDEKLAHRLERHARAAVSWLLHHGGLTEHGYLVNRPEDDGPDRQSWRDSPGSLCDADGAPLGKGLIAAAAPQGYAYDALRRTAGLARAVWDDPGYADQLEEAAAHLRARFLRDFPLPEAEGFPALALALTPEADGRRATALSSDAGHLLWSGILPEETGRKIGRRLLASDLFSGWGLRTLAQGQGAYHPLSYHRGGVWPHDTAVAALGLARYGLAAEARTLAEGVVALASASDGGRLPEVVGGYDRAASPVPVPHPHAGAPQAWAAAAPLALLTALGT